MGQVNKSNGYDKSKANKVTILRHFESFSNYVKSCHKLTVKVWFALFIPLWKCAVINDLWKYDTTSLLSFSFLFSTLVDDDLEDIWVWKELKVIKLVYERWVVFLWPMDSAKNYPNVCSTKEKTSSCERSIVEASIRTMNLSLGIISRPYTKQCHAKMEGKAGN